VMESVKDSEKCSHQPYLRPSTLFEEKHASIYSHPTNLWPHPPVASHPQAFLGHYFHHQFGQRRVKPLLRAEKVEQWLEVLEAMGKVVEGMGLLAGKLVGLMEPEKIGFHLAYLHIHISHPTSTKTCMKLFSFDVDFNFEAEAGRVIHSF
jgi:hypothetical protein